jgi:hypothetical protein
VEVRVTVQDYLRIVERYRSTANPESGIGCYSWVTFLFATFDRHDHNRLEDRIPESLPTMRHLSNSKKEESGSTDKLFDDGEYNHGMRKIGNS